MKLVIAIIQPERLDEVRQALIDAEIGRVTVTRVAGHGRRQDIGLYRGQQFTPGLTSKVRIDIALNDAFVEPAVQAILKAAKHGADGADGSDEETGDGKIFVVPLDDCIRIRTGERGSDAI